MAIPRHEVAPVTDEEWAEALRDYGRDREQEDSIPLESNPCLLENTVEPIHTRPASPFRQTSYRALQHQDSFDSLTDHLLGADTPRRGSSQADSTSRSGSHPSDHGAPLGLNLSLPSTIDENAVSTSPRASFSLGSEDGCCMTREPSKQTMSFGPAYTIGAPRRKVSIPAHVLEEERRTGEAERQAIRKHYEEEGWLAAPQPSRCTKTKRKRAIRRLGLCCNAEEDRESQAVMAKYAEMAKQIFRTRSAGVNILFGDEAVLWGADPDEPPVRAPYRNVACGHSVIRDKHSCMVIADAAKDWRFKNGPSRKAFSYQFYASAPLRYTRKGHSVGIGALCIYDPEPRDVFDEREQAILLNLANMLVYQLTTLHSEVMAKKSSAMYENCIKFLRRSVMADTAAIKEEAERTKREHKERERSSKDRRGKHGHFGAGPSHPIPSKNVPTSPLSRPRQPSRSDSKTSSSATSVGPELAPVAVKVGPRDSRAAKRDEDSSERVLFTDAAKTLRGTLKADAVAIVDIDAYQLFIRRSSGLEHDSDKRKIKEKTKQGIITSFLKGEPWPEGIDPVIHHVPRSDRSGVSVLGADISAETGPFHFNRPGSEKTMTEFIQRFLKTRHFWWDREDEEDGLSRRIVELMPNEAQTILGSAFLTGEGKCRLAIFASWNRPPAEFGDSQTTALPFTWILGGCTMAALAVRKIRSLEQSQITYSNLQAHELRTPLHQILAITQLLRSSMNDLANSPQAAQQQSLTTTQQVRDLLPFLDAIDTSGTTLQGIVDNILSFLDLKGRDDTLNASPATMFKSPLGVTQTIEVMFEELIHEAYEEDKRSRRANGLPVRYTETVFEIIPPLLGEEVTEDTGGALRRALSKILSNAYKFIDDEGCVEIYVDDVTDLLPPEGCEDLARSKNVKIIIKDNGKGMDAAFVREKLGEPWAKEDPYAIGSGLSVHLAYRIIDLMGGAMRITSGQGQGCTVELEVPIPRRPVTSPISPQMGLTPHLRLDDPAQLARDPEDIELQRQVAFVGFRRDGPGVVGRERLEQALTRQYKKLGCDVVDKGNADLVILDGRVEEVVDGVQILRDTPARDIVFLVGNEHEAHPDVLRMEQKLGKTVRRFRKPATPSILRETLFPGQSKVLVADQSGKDSSASSNVNSPTAVDAHGNAESGSPSGPPKSATPRADRPKAHFAQDVVVSDASQLGEEAPPQDVKMCPVIDRFSSLWKPRTMDVEDAVACLSLGDYFASRTRNSLRRIASNDSSAGTPSTPTLDTIDLGATPQYETLQFGSDSSVSDAKTSLELDRGPGSHGDAAEDPQQVVQDMGGGEGEDEDEADVDVEQLVKVMVVEDNMVNRKILVRILSSKQLPIEVCEAEDGEAAIELFNSFSSPAIVLLDINMPKMDGYQACAEMRAIEKADKGRGSSQIIAVTALGAESERHRGLVECGMDQWFTKPCSKATIQRIVEEARQALLEARSQFESESEAKTS